MSTYKFIALDMDGTLLNRQQEISEQNLHWIKKAEDSGLIVSFATGRGRASSQPYWGAVSPLAPMVLSNGAEIWKNHDELLARYTLPADQVPRLINLAKDYGAQYWTLGNCSDDSSEVGDRCLKVGMHHEEREVIQELRAIVTSWDLVEVSASAPYNIELNRKGVTKAAGLAEVTQLLGIKPKEVVAVGDSLNDLAMIQWAGLGVAMANAEEPITEAADLITASNEEDGVARVIQLVLEEMS
jgi:HAD superfamily hydrolase (TIGR01484 family)